MTGQVLDVTTLAPMRCFACGGDGEVVRCEVVAIGWRVADASCAADTCGHCGGTGEEPCSRCGEAAAVAMHRSTPVCARCAEEVAHA